MDKLNQGFQELLRERHFNLKTTEREAQYLYQGRFAIEADRILDFEILVPKSNFREVVQIVFKSVAICEDETKRPHCLKVLNDLNLKQGINYYFCLGEDDKVFARTMLPVDPDRTDVLMDLIQIGSHLLCQIDLEQFF